MVQQAEAEAWVFRTTEVLEGGGSDSAQLRHGRQARKRMATDARDSRHISEAGGLMMSKQPRKSKDTPTPAGGRSGSRENSAPASAPEYPPLPTDAVAGLVGRAEFQEPPIPEQQVRIMLCCVIV